ncbi:MAG: hypothetical protein KH328_10500 [Staphylococcus sp.]|nr:hypothetical protein [Staphylococcus sp.]
MNNEFIDGIWFAVQHIVVVRDMPAIAIGIIKESYFKRIVIDRKLKDVCLGRNKVAYLANEVESSISKDCPLETAKEESK